MWDVKVDESKNKESFSGGEGIYIRQETKEEGEDIDLLKANLERSTRKYTEYRQKILDLKEQIGWWERSWTSRKNRLDRTEEALSLWRWIAIITSVLFVLSTAYYL